MTLLLLLVSWAFADEPVAAWTTRAVPLHRWADGAVEIASLEPGARVEVLVADGNQTRVRRGIDFGWVPSDALTKVAPPNAAATDDAMPTFEFGDIKLTPKAADPAPPPPPK